MKCPVHPRVEMTALFTSQVCDLCHPAASPAPPAIPSPAPQPAPAAAFRYVTCPTCGHWAGYARHDGQVWLGVCIADDAHVFKHAWQIGDRTRNSAIRSGVGKSTRDCEWTASGWQNVAPASPPALPPGLSTKQKP